MSNTTCGYCSKEIRIQRAANHLQEHTVELLSNPKNLQRFKAAIKHKREYVEITMKGCDLYCCFGCGTAFKDAKWLYKHIDDHTDCVAPHQRTIARMVEKYESHTPVEMEKNTVIYPDSDEVAKLKKEIAKLKKEMEYYKNSRDAYDETEELFFRNHEELREEWDEYHKIVCGCIVRGEYDEDEMKQKIDSLEGANESLEEESDA